MLLHGLDEDALAIVVSYLSPVRQDVINLMLTCRALYPVGRYPEHVSIHCPSSQFVSLTNLIIEDPYYGQAVRSLHLRVEGKKSVPRANIWAFLQRFPNLRCLHFDADVLPRYTPLLLSPDLAFRYTLQELRLVDSTLDITNIMGLLALPNLRHLNLPIHRKGLLSPTLAIALEGQPQLPHLKSLRLGPSGPCLGVNSIEHILRRCSSFETLEWRIGSAFWEPHPLPLWDPGSLGTFLPSCRVLRALTGVADTLVNLRLYSGAKRKPSYKGEGLDLSSFTALKNVVAGAEFFFKPLSSKVERDGFYELLPPKLENLSLVFSWEISIFFNIVYFRYGAGGPVKGQSLQSLQSSDYRFILEIAEVKRERFPFLKKIHFHESTRQNGEPFVPEEWIPPPHVQSAFEEAGTELLVTVRALRKPEDVGENLRSPDKVAVAKPQIVNSLLDTLQVPLPEKQDGASLAINGGKGTKAYLRRFFSGFWERMKKVSRKRKLLVMRKESRDEEKVLIGRESGVVKRYFDEKIDISDDSD